MTKIIELKEHNQITYECMQKAFEERNHVGIVQATGTGKSYIVAKAISDSGSDNVLFLTSSNHITDEFKKNFSYLVDKITFMTYKKLSFVKDLEKYLLTKDFDFVILDEYHRCGARTWGSAAKTMLSVYKDKKVLGVTATPIRFLDNNRDMTKELFDSEPLVEMTLLDALKEDILKKPKYVLSYYDVENNLRLLKDKADTITNQDIVSNVKYLIDNMDNIVNVEDVLKQNITSERKFIVFCSNIDHAKASVSVVSKWFKDIGFKTNVYTLYTDYSNSSSSRKTKIALEKFKNAEPTGKNVHLLFAVNMLNEGVHVDDVDGLIFLRKSVSPIVVTQQLGRALKSGNENSVIIFDLVNNLTELSFDGAFPLDDDRERKLRAKKEGKDYSIRNAIEIKDYTVDINNVLRKINELYSESKWSNFKKALVEFKDTYGHCDVPSGHNLYKRCLRLKKQYAKGLLEKHICDELDELGFNWNFGIYKEDAWQSMFEKLKSYKDIYGNTNVPRNYEDSQLATWVHTQRKYKDKMLEERKSKLLSIGFEFEVAQKTNEERWESMFKRLNKFKEEFGHVRVSSRYIDKELANWVNTQKKAYKSFKLPLERYERLVEIGFEFPQR